MSIQVNVQHFGDKLWQSLLDDLTRVFLTHGKVIYDQPLRQKYNITNVDVHSQMVESCQVIFKKHRMPSWISFIDWQKQIHYCDKDDSWNITLCTHPYYLPTKTCSFKIDQSTPTLSLLDLHW